MLDIFIFLFIRKFSSLKLWRCKNLVRVGVVPTDLRRNNRSYSIRTTEDFPRTSKPKCHSPTLILASSCHFIKLFSIKMLVSPCKKIVYSLPSHYSTWMCSSRLSTNTSNSYLLRNPLLVKKGMRTLVLLGFLLG